MKVKKYVAASMPEAMKQIREELGTDAVILNSKVIQTGGFLGFFKKKNIEVIAAVEPKPNTNPIPVVKEKNRRKANVPIVTHNHNVETIQDIQTNILHDPKEPSKDLIKEIEELKKMMKDMSTAGTKPIEKYPELLQKIYKNLSNQDINTSNIEFIMTELLEKWYVKEKKASSSEILDWTKDIMLDQIDKYQYGGISYQKKYINVVGPTGVGKTTTLAKIAADAVIKDKKRVAFITTDTYRIAAIDQLKTYANILGIPLEVCYNLNDFKSATERFDQYDVVLVDTAGRNFLNQHYVSELKKVINFNENMETFLVLSVTSKEQDMNDIYKQFSLLTIDRIIFTKVDETSNFGAMYNFILDQKIGVAYLTNGQNVPDDILEASPTTVIDTILEAK